MLRKSFSLFLALLLLVTSFPLQSFATEIVEEPAAEETSAVEVVTEDIESEEAEEETVIEESVEEEPIVEETVVEEEPVDQEPVVEETVVEEAPVDQEPVVEETVVEEEPVDQEPIVEETVVEEEPVDQEPVTEETVPEETVTEETVPEETVPEETVPEETVPEETEPEETYIMKGVLIDSTTGTISRPSSSYGTKELTKEFTLSYNLPVVFDFTGSQYGNFRLRIYNADTDELVWSTDSITTAGISYAARPLTVNLGTGNYELKLNAVGSSPFRYTMEVYYNKTFTTSEPLFYVDPSPVSRVIYKNAPTTFKVSALPTSATVPSVEWSVSDTSIAEVSADGTVSAKQTGTVTLTAKVGGQTLSCVLKTVVPEFTALEDFTLEKGQTKTLTIGVTPADYPVGTIKWKSSDSKIAKVDSNGVVTAKKPGTATITATVDGEKIKCKVTVIETYVWEEEVVSKVTGTLYYYSSTQLTDYFFVPYEGAVTFDFTGSYSGNYKLFIYDSDTEELVWSTNSSGVSYKETTQVVELPMGLYKYKLTAGTSSFYYTMKATYRRVFTNLDPYYYLTPSPTEYFIYKDDPMTIKVKAKPSSAEIPKITWSVDNTKIAKISSKGKVTAKKTGDVTVTAKFGDHKLSLQYHCITPTYTEPKDFSLYETETKTLKIKVAPSGYPMDGIKWKSSNTKVAKVSSKGKVTAVGEGKATITATVNGETFKIKVTVKPPKYSGLKDFSLYVGETETLKIKVTPSDYPIKSIKWKSSDTKIAKVSSKGKVTAKKAGTCTITATVNGEKIKCKVTVKPMKINKTSKSLEMGDTYTLKIYGGDGKVTWKTSDSKIAKVSSKGKVTALKAGTCTITGKKDGKSFKCKLTVKWPAETGTTKTKKYDLPNGASSVGETLYLHSKTKLTITGKVNSGYDNLYISLSDQNSPWTNHCSLFIKEEDGKVSKTLTLPAGEYRFYYDTRSDADITLKMECKPGIYSSLGTKYIGRGYTNKLKTVGVKNGGTWSSSDSTIASVSSKGVVTGKKNGSATIYYTMKDGKKLSFKVKVVNPVTVEPKKIYDTSIYNEVDVTITNYTNKTIKYVEFYMKQYNYKGSALRSPYSYYFYDSTISPNSSVTGYEYWVHDHTQTVKITIKEVGFTDGTRWRP